MEPQLDRASADAVVAKRTAPKVTIESIKARIASVEYFHRGTLCLAFVTMQNGYMSVGVSRPVAPHLFDHDVGERYAYDDAIEQLWPLEGYLLREDLYRFAMPYSEVVSVVKTDLGMKQTFKPAIIDGCDFGTALVALKAGKRVARAGWNGKDMWLSLSNDKTARIPASSFWSKNNADYAADQSDGCATVLPCITMRTATGEILMGWLASQTDMLAEDWCVFTG